MDDRLKNTTIVVTRPADQAQNLCRLIEEAGGEAIRFPVMEIDFTPESDEARQQLEALAQQIDSYQMAIFVSTNAVQGAARVLPRAMPPRITLAAVGRATAAAARQCWQREVVVPAERFNSEGLLALPRLQQVKHQKIVIFRGQGGREKLAAELVNRGAEVTYAEVYRRVIPKATLDAVRRRPVDAIVVTSNEGLQNLYQLAGTEQRAWLLTQQLIVISPRSADLARQLGFKRDAITAPAANDQGMLSAVLSWKNNDQKQRN